MNAQQGSELLLLTDDVGTSFFRLEELVNAHEVGGVKGAELKDVALALSDISARLLMLASRMAILH